MRRVTRAGKSAQKRLCENREETADRSATFSRHNETILNEGHDFTALGKLNTEGAGWYGMAPECASFLESPL